MVLSVLLAPLTPVRLCCPCALTCAARAGMEEDGMDETILPTDFKRAGQIRDTELARVLCHPLPHGVTLHALFDSCHSGAAWSPSLLAGVGG